MTDRMESVELLGCPFCGSKPDMVREGDFVSVACPHYYCNFSQIALRNEAKAIERWNTRASPAGGESGLPLWQQLQLGMLLGKLSDWRNADHEDSIALCRSDICCLLDALATPPAAEQSVDIEAAVAATANSIMAIRMMVDERAEAFVRKELEALIRAVQPGGDAEIELLRSDNATLRNLHLTRESERASLSRRLYAAREALDAIRQYGSDTLSGRTDGPDDWEWQRAAVLEMRNRAIAALEGTQS